MSSPVLTILVKRLADLCTEDEARELAIPTLADIKDAACDDATEQRRAFRCADIACRVWVPRFLRATEIPDLIECAETLEALAPVVDRAAAVEACSVASAASWAASSVGYWAASSAGSRAASWAASRAASWAASNAAPEAASWAAYCAASCAASNATAVEANRAATLTELRDLIRDLVAMEVPS